MHETNKMNSWKKALISFTVLIIYLLVGGGIFHVMEGVGEQEGQNQIFDVVSNFLGNNSCVDSHDLGEFIQEVVYWGDGYLINDGNISTADYMPDHWDFAGSVFFAATVVTTIGYGHISPSSYGGGALCVVYAFFGIPLTALFLAYIGECFADSWIAWNAFLVKYISCFSKHERSKKVVSTVVLAILSYILIILIPGVVFTKIESWDTLTSQYFCFISLSTIGFGDYVIGQNDPKSYGFLKAYKLLTILYILFGLSVLTLSFKQLQVIYQVKVRRPRVKGRVKRKTITLNRHDIEMSVRNSKHIDDDLEIEIDVESDELCTITCDASVQTDF